MNDPREEKDNSLQIKEMSSNKIELVCLCCGEIVYKFEFKEEMSYNNGQPFPQSPIVLCYNCFYYKRDMLGLPLMVKYADGFIEPDKVRYDYQDNFRGVKKDVN